MSDLFSPCLLGGLEIRNRFVHSACEDNMATELGEVTEGILRKNRNLARGEVGLIIWSNLFVPASGRGKRYQSGIHSDRMVEGLGRVCGAVHSEGGKIAFQLGHAGIQTEESLIGQKPLGPKTMTDDQIHEIITTFVEAAKRAIGSGVESLQVHAAHGYLINEFLSPFFNTRTDGWGGSDENRFRMLKEIVDGIIPLLP
jgi:2,4-dienoyl-CoA reductase-like NADH-dependent reductase (Old Yellow Enzyme family)